MDSWLKKKEKQLGTWDNQSPVISLMTVSEFIHVYRQIYNCIKCNWPRHDLPSLENKKVKQSAKLLKVHIQERTFGKRCKDKNNEAFIPETASGNSSEWEESDKITSQKKIKNTDKKRENAGKSRRRRRRVIRDQGDPAPLRNMFCL